MPTPETATRPTREYAVFLSYRHEDNKQIGRQWASWLHHALETYEVPPDLIGTLNSCGKPIPASLYPVFRDEEELPADADLGTNIRAALERSRLLVVLCSPRAVASRFVAEEIRIFKELGRADRILALMIDGEPNASDDPAKQTAGLAPALECLPDPLRFGCPREGGADGTTLIDWTQRTEPIAADVRPEGRAEQGWTTAAAYRESLGGDFTRAERDQLVRAYDQRLRLAVLKIVAGAVGVPLGTLTKRDQAQQLARARRRARIARRLAAVFIVLGLLAVAGAVLAWQQRNAVLVREAEQRKLLHEASMSDYAVALQRIENEGKWYEGVAHLARALDWEPTNALAASRLYMTLSFYAAEKQNWPRRVLGHESFVNGAEFSSDGARIVTASDDKTARIWDATTGHSVGEPLRHDAEVRSAQFSPDGARIVTASRDNTARIWDAATGKPVGELLRHEDNVASAQFSSAGALIVTASLDTTARIWDAATGEPIGEPLRHEGWVNSAEFSPDASRIVTASRDKTARIWDVATGEPLGTPLGHEDEVWGAQFSPDGSRIVTISVDKTARIWEAATGRQLGEPLRHGDKLWSAEFSGDGTRIVTASGDGSARVWDATSGQPIGQPIRHNDSVKSAKFSPDGFLIVTASWDETARVWDADTGLPIGEPLRHSSALTSAQFSADGSHILTASFDQTARMWDANTRKPLGEPLRHEDRVNSTEFSPDGSRIVTASDDKTARIWEAASGKQLGEPLRHQDKVSSARFSPNGFRIVTASPHISSFVSGGRWNGELRAATSLGWTEEGISSAWQTLPLTPVIF